MEDILVHDWDVPYSFSIRYKHLLVNRQGQQETDEDIDHILGVGAGKEAGSDEEIGHIEDIDNDDMNDAEDYNEETGHDTLTGQYFHASSYTSTPQYPPPYSIPTLPPQMQNNKRDNNSRVSSELPSRPQAPFPGRGVQHGYGPTYPYGPSVDPWRRPTPCGGGHDGLGGYGGYGMYGGYGAHVLPPECDGRQSSQLPRYYGYPTHHMIPPSPSRPDTNSLRRQRSQGSTSSDNNARSEIAQSPFPMSQPGFHPYGYAQDFHNNDDDRAELKQETTEIEMRGEVLTNSIGDDNSAAALEAELRATELELKVARLQAKRAALSAQTKKK